MCNETFFLSNMAPQVGKGFNRDKWEHLESWHSPINDDDGGDDSGDNDDRGHDDDNDKEDWW